MLDPSEAQWRRQPPPRPIRPGKINALRALLTDEWRKPLLQILHESVAAAIRNRGLPRFYIKHLLYRCDVNDWRHYLSDREERRVQEAIKDGARVPFLQNKLLFHYHFDVPGIQLPPLVGYNVGSTFFSPAGDRPLATCRDLLLLLTDVRARTGAARMFVKPIGGIHGKQCFILDPSAADDERTERHLQDLQSGSFLFEQALTQHTALAAIYPNSVNTLRVVTYTNREGVPRVISTLLRLGADGSCTDNASSGGLFVKVNMDSGALAPYARRFYEFGGTVHFTHPTTGVGFSGRIVPHFQAALRMVRAAARHIAYRVVGWDVAITEAGPVIVEGNHNPHIFGAEIADGGYKRNPVFRAFLDDYGVL